MCTHTLSCYNLDSIFDIPWICILCFSITLVVAIFEMGTIFMTRPPPSLISVVEVDFNTCKSRVFEVTNILLQAICIAVLHASHN